MSGLVSVVQKKRVKTCIWYKLLEKKIPVSDFVRVMLRQRVDRTDTRTQMFSHCVSARRLSNMEITRVR
jgi:hypothetical protein